MAIKKQSNIEQYRAIKARLKKDIKQKQKEE